MKPEKDGRSFIGGVSPRPSASSLPSSKPTPSVARPGVWGEPPGKDGVISGGFSCSLTAYVTLLELAYFVRKSKTVFISYSSFSLRRSSRVASSGRAERKRRPSLTSLDGSVSQTVNKCQRAGEERGNSILSAQKSVDRLADIAEVDDAVELVGAILNG